ncbi:MAG: DUF72 domain-containing protein [Armatimonadota bacterium]
MRMEFRLGTCGWSFSDWKGTFYPSGTKDELAYYASQFDTVEIDSTYYRIPTAKAVGGWRARTPPGFLFCPKLPGEITHEKLLEGADDLVASFIDVISRLSDKLGPILIQLHPSFGHDQLLKLEAFLSRLPTGLRYAVEFRHRSWADRSDALELLRSLNMGLAMAHHPWYARIREATADFAYLRLLGRRNVFPDFGRLHRPHDEALADWAQCLTAIASRVARAYVFVNNQFEGHSPATIARLRALLPEGTPCQ